MSPSDDRARTGLVQAPVEPLDEDGVQIALIGTMAWLVALAVVWQVEAVEAWWRWVCVAGAVLGVIGVAYCLRRRRSS